MKRHWWKIEYSITLLVLAAFIALLFPVKFENYRQARMINLWKERYEKLAYMFNVINAQTSDEILKSFKILRPGKLGETN